MPIAWQFCINRLRLFVSLHGPRYSSDTLIIEETIRRTNSPFGRDPLQHLLALHLSCFDQICKTLLDVAMGLSLPATSYTIIFIFLVMIIKYTSGQQCMQLAIVFKILLCPYYILYLENFQHTKLNCHCMSVTAAIPVSALCVYDMLYIHLALLKLV